MIGYQSTRLKSGILSHRKIVICIFRAAIFSCIFLNLVIFPFSNTINSNIQKSGGAKRSIVVNNARRQRLLIISLDGFRHDFIEKYNLKNFANFIEESARALYFNPQFTTQAFPNHWSIATGAYVETHGIVANKFYDPQYNEFFQEQNKELKWWNATEPFWVSSVNQGKIKLFQLQNDYFEFPIITYWRVCF